MRPVVLAVPILSLLMGCAPDPQLPPETASTAVLQRTLDPGPAPQPQRMLDTASASEGNLPSGYTLTDTTDWGTMLEDGKRAILRRSGVTIDTVDLTFGVASVGRDSLVFLPVRTDSTPMSPGPVPGVESFPTEHVLWTPASRHKLHDILPFFSAYFSSPTMRQKSVIHYWGIARRDSTNRVYAMRYDFPTAHVDSLFLNREDTFATDYRYHLGLPQIQGNEVSFDGLVVDRTTWQLTRQDPPPE